jgi:hypothetical protein
MQNNYLRNSNYEFKDYFHYVHLQNLNCKLNFTKFN